jgi:acid phosphatase
VAYRLSKLLGAVAVLFALGHPVLPAHADNPPLGCAPKPEPPAGDFTYAPNFDLAFAFLKKQLLYYRCTSYDADLAKVIDDALGWVKTRAPEVAASGRVPAIVLDIDETSLSNWRRIYRGNFLYIHNGDCDLTDDSKPCGDLAWQRSGKAPAIEPTLSLYKFARCIDVQSPCNPLEVFFITGRRENGASIDNKTPRQWTRDNLIEAGYAGVADDHLILRQNSIGSVADYKSAAREAIQNGFQVKIIANIGDQQSDLDNGFADRPFKLPNPFYFIP